MTLSEAENVAATRHALNNLLAKIMGAAELALDQSSDPTVRAELETIIGLVEEGGSLIAALQTTTGEP